MEVGTYFGDGSPSASHSMTKGLSFSPGCATWNSISSVGGCLMMRGGEWTVRGEEKKKQTNMRIALALVWFWWRGVLKDV